MKMTLKVCFELQIIMLLLDFQKVPGSHLKEEIEDTLLCTNTVVDLSFHKDTCPIGLRAHPTPV